MNKAVFLDRDGVINHDPGDYTKSVEEFTINDGALESLKLLVDNGYLLILITNQGGIAKKKYTKSDVSKIHDYFLGTCLKHDIKIEEIYYCPHHSDIENCICRKPNSLLVEKAIARFNIDPEKSFFIGDKMRDIECGNGAGVKGIKIDVNENILPIIKSQILI